MPEIQFPLQTAPGVNAMESGGRLINAYVEKAPPGSRGKYVHRRVPGLRDVGLETETGHRGELLVGTVLYVISGTHAYTISKNTTTGVYTITQLTGDPIGGTGRVFLDRNMNATPQVLIVTTAGMYQINTGAGTVAAFSDADLPAPNSICFVGSYFFPSIGDGRTFASGINAVTFASTDFARAESSPDGLVRNIRYGRDLAMMGTQSIEFWGNVGNPTGFPFSFSSVIPVGLLTPHAVAGFELGFAGPVVFVAADRTVQALVGYAAEKISTPDLDALLDQVEVIADIEVSVFVAKGHRFATVSCDDWTWVYTFPDKDTPGGWHERKSYSETFWRIGLTANAFNEWLGFDRDSSAIYLIDPRTKKEAINPLVWEVRSTQTHAFPSRIEFNRLALDFVVGVGIDAGQDPIETNPRVLVSYSDDGGRIFSNERELMLGTQGQMVTVEDWLWGTTGTRGRQWRLRISDPIEISLLGGAWDGNVVE